MATKDKEVAKETDGTATEPSYITVKSNLPAKPDGGFPVALHEKDKAHPGPDHEIFVAGPAEVQAGETSAVLRAISEGKLVKV